MAVTDPGFGATRRILPQFSDAIARVMARARERRRIRREMIALSDLPDHMLQDMGLHNLGAWRELNICDSIGWRKDSVWRPLR